jgi:hypothetical protein
MTTQTPKDGGAAFPRQFVPPGRYADRHSSSSWAGHQEQSGMSLRDWFAGQALAGILASFPPDAHFATDKAKKALADDSYALAEAMLRARTTQTPGEER